MLWGRRSTLETVEGRAPLSGIAPRGSPPILGFLFSLRWALSSPGSRDALPSWAFFPGQPVSPVPWHLPSIQAR